MSTASSNTTPSSTTSISRSTTNTTEKNEENLQAAVPDNIPDDDDDDNSTTSPSSTSSAPITSISTSASEMKTQITTEPTTQMTTTTYQMAPSTIHMTTELTFTTEMTSTTSVPKTTLKEDDKGLEQPAPDDINNSLDYQGEGSDVGPAEDSECTKLANQLEKNNKINEEILINIKEILDQLNKDVQDKVEEVKKLVYKSLELTKNNKENDKKLKVCIASNCKNRHSAVDFQEDLITTELDTNSTTTGQTINDQMTTQMTSTQLSPTQRTSQITSSTERATLQMNSALTSTTKRKQNKLTPKNHNLKSKSRDQRHQNGERGQREQRDQSDRKYRNDRNKRSQLKRTKKDTTFSPKRSTAKYVYRNQLLTTQMTGQNIMKLMTTPMSPQMTSKTPLTSLMTPSISTVRPRKNQFAKQTLTTTWYDDSDDYDDEDDEDDDNDDDYDDDIETVTKIITVTTKNKKIVTKMITMTKVYEREEYMRISTTTMKHIHRATKIITVTKLYQDETTMTSTTTDSTTEKWHQYYDVDDDQEANTHIKGKLTKLIKNN